MGKPGRVLAEVTYKSEIPYELVVVNDGSGDRTWEENSEGRREGCECDRRSFFPEISERKQRFFAGLAQGLWRCGGCHGL